MDKMNILNTYQLIDFYRRTKVFKNYKKYQSDYSLPSEQLLTIQKQNLSLFLISQINNNYFKQFLINISIKEIYEDPIDILKSFPINDKHTYKENFDSIFNTSFKNLTEVRHTGGSTGIPFKYIIDKDSISNSIAFNYYLWNKFLKYNISDKILVIGGSSLTGTFNIQKRVYDFLQNKITINTPIVNKYGASLIKDVVNRSHNGIFIYGYPSKIIEYINLLKELDIKIKNINGIITTSEMLYDSDKFLIQEFFNCDVLNVYGANDGGIMSGSVDNKSFIYNGLTCFVESIDIDGQMELILTNLSSRAFPFIRYKVGDLGDLESGNGYPFIINNLKGRNRDLLYSKDGGKVHGATINQIFERINFNCQYQIEQFSDYSCNVYYKLLSIEIDKLQKLSIFKDELEKFIGYVEIKTIEVENFKLFENGKHKLIISHVS